MGKPAAGMISVATPTIGDVQIKRHALDVEAASLTRMCYRVRKRLNRWLREMPEQVACIREVGRDGNGKPIFEQMRDADGTPLLEPFIPGKDWTELFRWYSSSTLGLLKEQRERAKLGAGKGAPPVDDATFDAQITELVRAAVLEMPKAELEALLRMRAIDVPVGEVTPGANNDDDPRLKL